MTPSKTQIVPRGTILEFARNLTMFKLALLAAALISLPALAQTTAQSPQIQAELNHAMSGQWTGVLEYRDYSDPATSTKRVFLPTWLTITPTAAGLSRHFVYDDGPGKTINETDIVSIDVANNTYAENDAGKPAQIEHVTGYATLKTGRGDLVLTGIGIDDDRPTETRTMLIIRRNLISWILEVRPANSTEPFAFRHRFTFTRAQIPPLTPAPAK
jgi:hypothetical protein